MWNFSNDEWAFFVAAAFISVVDGFFYYQPLTTIPSLAKSNARRCTLALLPLVAMVPLLVVLSRWADPKVVGHYDYILLFAFGDAALIFLAAQFMSLLGISFRGDSLDRDNPAAVFAIGGVILGLGIVYALCNIGSGPTIWTTLLPALVATIALLLLTIAFELIAGTVVDNITIDRDSASALRFSGTVLGAALILGRAGAGDWISWPRTWSDFATHSWPAVVLIIVGGITHRLLQPTIDSPRPNVVVSGIIPGGLLFAAGLLALLV